jgi:hypothetical protein
MWHEGLMPQMILLSFYFVLTFLRDLQLVEGGLT